MSKLLMIAFLLLTKLSVQAGDSNQWCYGNDQCPQGYVCKGGGGWSNTPGKCYQASTFELDSDQHCAFYPEICMSVENVNRCWFDEDCAYPQRCYQKSDYIPGYCI